MIHDISVPLRTGGTVYPGNPPILIEPQQRIADGRTSNVSSLAMGSHTGTHVDASKHFFDHGTGVDALSLEVLMGPALVIHLGDDVRAVTAEHLPSDLIAGHTRVLLRTRNSAFVATGDFVQDYTYVAPDGAAHLVAAGVRLVGVDYFSVEQFRSGHHRTHRTLLEAGVIIVEGLDLSGIRPGIYDFRCLPLRLEGLDGAPARAVLIDNTGATAQGRT